MTRPWLVLMCAVLVLCALAPVASAAGKKAEEDPAWKFGGTAPALWGIHRLLTGLFVALAVVCGSVGMVALMLMAAALSPERVARAEAALRRGRWQAVFLGIASAVALVLLATALFGGAAKAGAAILGVAGVLVLGFLFWLAVFGLAAMATIVGQRLLGDSGPSPWRVVGAGGLVVVGSVLVPLFGWAYFLYVLCRGIGAATLGLFSWTPPPAPPAARDQQPPA